jgi:serine/threonine-protein kinase
METIGRIQIEREIGRGGMGVVYKGFDPFLDRHVALKSVLPPQNSDQSWEVSVKRLEQEARAAARLNHPNIVTVYDVIPAADSFCVVMEFVEGTSLEAACPEGTCASPEFVARIIGECAAGLDHAHSRGVIHRDI